MSNFRYIDDARNINASLEAKESVKELLSLCYKLRETASKNYGYDRLNEWSKPISDLISTILYRHGFKNGEKEYNDTLPDVVYIWKVYETWTLIIYSPNLKTKVANHHASAYERNEAFIIELENLLK